MSYVFRTIDALGGVKLTSYLAIEQTTGSLYFWAAHLAGPKWGPFASWCCAWLETIGLIAGIGTQVFIHRKKIKEKVEHFMQSKIRL